MNISFAWTTADFEAGRKTATRRFWPDKYARLFPAGSRHSAWNKSPRFKGSKIGFITVVSLFKQPLSQMTEADLREEGTLWSSVDEYVEMMLSQGKGDTPWVVRFDAFNLSGNLIAMADRGYKHE
ncbi:MAG: hypothetical protein V1701_02575 [Planctomycetota bacterium]